MRHGNKINHLGRTYSHRKAMISNMACSLILHKRIFTTLAKAKELRVFVEPLITKSKLDSTHSRRVVFSNLQDKNAVNELFREVSAKVMNRPGGYTRIIKLGKRLGDNAEMCMIELVDFNEIYNNDAPAKKTTRRSRKKTTTENTVADAAVTDEVVVQEEAVVEDTEDNNSSIEDSTNEDDATESSSEEE